MFKFQGIPTQILLVHDAVKKYDIAIDFLLL